MDADYFVRWVTDLKGTGTIPVEKLNDNGFSFQASGMIVDRKLHAYGTYSWIDGQYGDPSPEVLYFQQTKKPHVQEWNGGFKVYVKTFSRGIYIT